MPIIAIVYWLIAGSWIFLGLDQLVGLPFQSVKLWQMGVGEHCHEMLTHYIHELRSKPGGHRNYWTNFDWLCDQVASLK